MERHEKTTEKQWKAMNMLSEIDEMDKVLVHSIVLVWPAAKDCDEWCPTICKRLGFTMPLLLAQFSDGSNTQLKHRTPSPDMKSNERQWKARTTNKKH